MNDYFKDYKYSKIILVKLIEELEKVYKYVNTGLKNDINKIDLKNISNDENRKYICDLLNLNDIIITKEDFVKLLKRVRNEKEKDLNYEKEYYKVLLGFTYVLNDMCEVHISKELIESLKGNEAVIMLHSSLEKMSITDNDIDKDGNYVLYSSGNDLNSPILDAWKILKFSDEDFITKSEYESKQEEIKNILYDNKKIK